MTTSLAIPDTTQLGELGENIARISGWIDAGNADRTDAELFWIRLAKITEEAGEVIAAAIGMTGANPRKGVTHSLRDVEEELLDVAITALAAVEHLRFNMGNSAYLLADKAARVKGRAEQAGAVG